jgi:hypothetical protein
MEQQMSALDTKLEDLEGENDNLKSEKSEMMAKMRVSLSSNSLKMMEC